MPWRSGDVFDVRRSGVALAIGLLMGLVGGCSESSPSMRPQWERDAQARLPRASDPLWSQLRRTKIHLDPTSGLYRAEVPVAVKALAGTTVSLSGFVVPLSAQRGDPHFMLSRNTPVCPFCPPGEPNEVVEVVATGPVFAGREQVSLTGRFRLQDGAHGLFFRIDDAELDE